MREGVRYISIPAPAFQDRYRPGQAHDRFCRSVVYLLLPYFDPKGENIFHLNYVNQYQLALELKKRVLCRIVLTVHYFEWIFAFDGDRDRLLRLRQASDPDLTPQERQVLRKTERERLLFSVCDRIIAVANHSAETLQLVYGVDRSRITVISNALRDRKAAFSARKKQQLKARHYIGENEKVVLFAGRIEKLKGLDYLVEAFKEVLKRCPDTLLFIAGGSDVRMILQKLNPIWSKVCFSGFLNQQQLDDLYRMADVGVVPSLYEEFGYVALEMMMHGLPVIANRRAGLSELIRDDVSGRFVGLNASDVDRKSVGELADRIVELLACPDDCMRLGKAAREEYLNRYGIDLFLKKMVDFYLTEC